MGLVLLGGNGVLFVPDCGNDDSNGREHDDDLIEMMR